MPNFNVDLTGWFLRGAPKCAKQVAGFMLIWGVLYGFLAVILLGMIISGTRPNFSTGEVVFWCILLVLSVMALTAFALLMRRRRLGTHLAWIVSFFSLPLFPLGTFGAVACFFYLMHPDMSIWFDLNGSDVNNW